jgi:hypothetical protein
VLDATNRSATFQCSIVPSGPIAVSVHANQDALLGGHSDAATPAVTWTYVVPFTSMPSAVLVPQRSNNVSLAPPPVAAGFRWMSELTFSWRVMQRCRPPPHSHPHPHPYPLPRPPLLLLIFFFPLLSSSSASSSSHPPSLPPSLPSSLPPYLPTRCRPQLSRPCPSLVDTIPPAYS